MVLNHMMIYATHFDLISTNRTVTNANLLSLPRLIMTRNNAFNQYPSPSPSPQRKGVSMLNQVPGHCVSQDCLEAAGSWKGKAATTQLSL